MTIHISDEALPAPYAGTRAAARAEARAITIPQAATTARELIRCRIREEVDRHNESPTEVFQGLVQPEESERILNGFRMKTQRALSWESQYERACSSFQRNGFLLIVDGRQVCELDEPIELRADADVRFVKLVPLIGG